MKIFSFPSYLPSRSLLAYGVPSRATAISHWPAQRPMMKRRTAPSQGPDKVKEIGFTKHQPPPPPGPPLRARWGQRWKFFFFFFFFFFYIFFFHPILCVFDFRRRWVARFLFFSSSLNDSLFDGNELMKLVFFKQQKKDFADFALSDPRKCKVNENAATLPSKKKVEKRGEQKKSAKKITKRRGRATFATFAFVRFVERLREIPFFFGIFFCETTTSPIPSFPSGNRIAKSFWSPSSSSQKKRPTKKTSDALRVEREKMAKLAKTVALEKKKFSFF